MDTRAWHSSGEEMVLPRFLWIHIAVMQHQVRLWAPVGGSTSVISRENGKAVTAGPLAFDHKARRRAGVQLTYYRKLSPIKKPV